MAIQDLRNYLNNLWSFDEFDKCLKHGCKFSDIDAATERNGYLLFIETKSTNTKIPGGQKRMLRQATKVNKIIWLLVFGEAGYLADKPNQIDKFSVWYKGIEYSFPNGIKLGEVISCWQWHADKKNFTNFKKNILTMILGCNDDIITC